MKILLFVLMVSIVAGSLFAAVGTVHLIYSNGEIVEDGGYTYYDFDIQAYLSEGNETFSAGMAYVEYPVSVFGDLAITNGIVTVTKTGVLAGTLQNMEISLYDAFDNDTYADVFALTFDSPFAGMTDTLISNSFINVSTDPLAPSDLFHIRMLVSDFGTGNVLFPAYIPAQNLYFNYDNELFAGGLDITEATEAVVYEDTTVVDPPAPDPVGTVEFKSLAAAWKKISIEIKWSTRNEIDIAGYVIKRSVNGGEPVEIASYLTNPTLVAQASVNVMKYVCEDYDVTAGQNYSYLIEAIDIVGAALPYGPVNVLDGSVVEESYPNPFNPSFVVPFEIFSSQSVDIKLYNMAGRVVRNIASGTHNAGRYEYHVDCNDLSSGVYLL